MINFNDYREIQNRYLGSDKKKTIVIDGEKYLLKFPDPIREKGHEISYINNAFSEYIGCKIYESIGIPVQEVLLGTYTEISGKTKVACACKDFCKDGYDLYEAEGLLLSMTDVAYTHKTELSMLLNLIDSIKGVRDDLKTRFYDMMVVDTLICNPDRHNGNWGLLINSEGSTKVAPVYDCGSCLAPVSGDDELNASFAKYTALNTYSAILIDGKRIFCPEYIKSGKNRDLNDAVKRVVPNISVDKINKIIDDTPFVSDIRKDYYKQCIGISFDRILKPAYKHLIETDMVIEDDIAF